MGIANLIFRFWPFRLATSLSAPRITSASRRKQAIATVFSGAIAFFLLHLLLVTSCEFSRLLRDPLYADKEVKLRRLEKLSPPKSTEIVFLGTSRTGNGFEAGRAQSLATEKLGRPAVVFNWGIPGSGPVTHLLHLRRMLADGHHPNLLLLEILPSSLAELPSGSIESHLCEGDALDWNEIDWLGEYNFPADRLTSERRSVLLAPWYRLRKKIVGRLRPTMLPYDQRYDWSRGPDPNGWCPVVLDSMSQEQQAAVIERTRAEYASVLASMTLDNSIVRALRDVLSAAREAGIPVILVRMPEAEGFRSFYSAHVEAKIESFLHAQAAEFDCGICDARRWMSNDAFPDWHHMWRKDAGVFTEKLTSTAITPFLQSKSDGSQ